MTPLREAIICAKIINSRIFDANYYLEQNEDVDEAAFDPLLHYIRHGEQEFRNPCRKLSAKALRTRFASSDNALYEYVTELERYNDKIVIPICFCSNSEYSIYLGVAITSIIENASPDYIYKIYILHCSLSNEEIDKLHTLERNNIHISFINITDYAEKAFYSAWTSAHITTEAYFRLLIPDLFSEYDKILYLDCDLVTTKDIAKLYNMDISGFTIGAIENKFIDTEYYEKLKKNLPTSLHGNYYNSGVLLIDCHRFRSKQIFQKCLTLIKSGTHYICHDQDIINIVCERDIKRLPMTWNFQWQFYVKEDYTKMTRHDLIEYAQALTDASIIHFVSHKKPLDTDDGYLCNIFWKYAAMSPFYEELLQNCQYSYMERDS